jgi:hypothetical protein
MRLPQAERTRTNSKAPSEQCESARAACGRKASGKCRYKLASAYCVDTERAVRFTIQKVPKLNEPYVAYEPPAQPQQQPHPQVQPQRVYAPPAAPAMSEEEQLMEAIKQVTRFFENMKRALFLHFALLVVLAKLTVSSLCLKWI